MREKTLYWIGTPRHFLISAGMALADSRQSDAGLLLTSRYNYVKEIKKVLDEWAQSPFSFIKIIQRPARKNCLSRRLQIIRTNSFYRKFAYLHEFREIRAFAATSYAAQAFLYELRQCSPETKRIMVEDGGIFYNTQPLYGDIAGETYSRLKLLAGRLLYGRAWRAVKANGLHEIIDEIHLIAPELVRREWSSHKLVKLSPDPLRRLADTDLPSLYLRTYGSSVEKLEDIEFLIILSRSDGVENDLRGYVDRVNEILRIARKRGLRIAVKYHPKEEESDYMALAEKPWVTEIPRQLPIELLFVSNTRNLKFVLGDTSTALLSAPWLLPKLKSVSFANIVSKRPELIYPDFGGFGIDLIRSTRDLKEILLNA